MDHTQWGYGGWEIQNENPSLHNKNSSVDYHTLLNYSGLAYQNAHPSLQNQNSSVVYREHNSLGNYQQAYDTSNNSSYSCLDYQNAYPSMLNQNSSVDYRVNNSLGNHQESYQTSNHKLWSYGGLECQNSHLSLQNYRVENSQENYEEACQTSNHTQWSNGGYETAACQTSNHTQWSNGGYETAAFPSIENRNLAANYCHAFGSSRNNTQENISTVTSCEYQLPSNKSAPCGPEVLNEQDKELRDCEATESVNIKPKHKLGCDNSSMFVKTSDNSAKKLCCPFCDKVYTKLARHLETIHKEEPDVQKFLSFPKEKSRRVCERNQKNKN